MPDINDLINLILTDKKLAKSKNFAHKVYYDEPILKTAAQMANFTPPKYRDMRKLAKSSGNYYASEAKIFYEQGKFMENHTDDFTYQGEFSRYFPTYQAMNDHQLRGYFTWRSKVRQGIIEKTSLSFAFVYIYELLNQIGVSSPLEGFQALKTFWQAYKELDAQINHYLRVWLKDYVVYFNLDKSLLEDFAEANFDNRVLTLLKHEQHSPAEVFTALNALSSYKLESSRFFKQHPEAVKTVVYNVFSMLWAYYAKKRKSNICEKFFGRMHTNAYTMFRSAVFYQPQKHEDAVYQINDIYKYRCQNGSWSCERFLCYSGKNKQIGVLLKAIDFLMRQNYNFKSTLKLGKTTKIFLDIIDKEIEKYQAQEKQKALPKIAIDLGKLQDIRTNALITQNKLLVEELPEEQVAAEPPEPQTTMQAELPLNEAQYQFVCCLLYNKPYDGLLKAKGLLLSVVVDAINEQLFDLFNDTVIDYNGDQPELVEDYIADLKGIIKE